MAGTAVRLQSSGRVVTLPAAAEIGAGGEARVFQAPWDPRLAAKVYHRPTEERARKLARMVAAPPAMPDGGHRTAAWPLDLLRSPSDGRVVGFVMPRVVGMRPLLAFY